MTNYEQWRKSLAETPSEGQADVLLELLILTNTRVDQLYQAVPALANQCGQAINQVGNDLNARLVKLEGPPALDPDRPRLILP